MTDVRIDRRRDALFISWARQKLHTVGYSLKVCGRHDACHSHADGSVTRWHHRTSAVVEAWHRLLTTSADSARCRQSQCPDQCVSTPVSHHLHRPAYNTSVGQSGVTTASLDACSDSVYLTCSKKLTGSQLSLLHGINKKLKCETKNKMMSMIGPVQSRCHEGSPV